MARIATADLLAALVDEGTWRSWDVPIADPESDDDYRAELEQARADGADESVTTGSARIGDHPVAVVAGDFDFLAGSVGSAAAQRIVSAFERATSLGLPVIGLPTSGGTRMQEGTPAFLLMAAIATAVQRHNESGLPYLVYLRHPTTGGVLATWGSLGDVTFAQPGALVGFLGPRIYEGLYGHPFPDGIQSAAGLASAGVIDGVCEPRHWRSLVAQALTAWSARGSGPLGQAHWEVTGALPKVSTEPSSRLNMPGSGITGWQAVTATRVADRPGLAELLNTFDTAVELSGTQQGETAMATRLFVAVVDGMGCVLVGQDRRRQLEGQLIGPADLRLARRGMALAQRWGLPLVTVIDTQGAELSGPAELGALAGEIARSLATLSDLATATIALLIGGGAGGGALALLPCDRVIAAEDGWVTPLPPEGGSLIRYRTIDRAAEIADTSTDHGG